MNGGPASQKAAAAAAIDAGANIEDPGERRTPHEDWVPAIRVRPAEAEDDPAPGWTEDGHRLRPRTVSEVPPPTMPSEDQQKRLTRTQRRSITPPARRNAHRTALAQMGRRMGWKEGSRDQETFQAWWSEVRSERRALLIDRDLDAAQRVERFNTLADTRRRELIDAYGRDRAATLAEHIRLYRLSARGELQQVDLDGRPLPQRPRPDDE